MTTSTVQIVGAGPVGLTLAALLSKQGVRSVVHEKRTALTKHPQAHFVNRRSMEVLRGVGETLHDRVAALSPPREQWSSYVYCEGVSGGQVIATHRHRFEDLREYTPCEVQHVGQHRLSRELLRWVREECPLAEVRFGSHYEVGSPALAHELVVACDGAHSRNRELAGIAMESVAGNEDASSVRLLNVHFRTQPDVYQLLGDRAAMLYFVYNTDVVGVLVAHDMRLGDWVMQVPYLPGVGAPEARQMVRDAFQDARIDVEVLEVRPWSMSASVASTFVSGNVALAGDSAHVFPPAGGMGMNSGIADAAALAWRVAEGRPLQQYSDERREAAVCNTHLSLEMYRGVLEVARLLGLDSRLLQMQQRVFDAFPVSFAAHATLKAGLQLLRNGDRDAARRFVEQEGGSVPLMLDGQDLGEQYERPTVFEPRVEVGKRYPVYHFGSWREFPDALVRPDGTVERKL